MQGTRSNTGEPVHEQPYPLELAAAGFGKASDHSETGFRSPASSSSSRFNLSSTFYAWVALSENSTGAQTTCLRNAVLT